MLFFNNLISRIKLYMVLRWFVLEKKSLFLHPFKFRSKWEHEFFCCSWPLFAVNDKPWFQTSWTSISWETTTWSNTEKLPRQHCKF